MFHTSKRHNRCEFSLSFCWNPRISYELIKNWQHVGHLWLKAVPNEQFLACSRWGTVLSFRVKGREWIVRSEYIVQFKLLRVEWRSKHAYRKSSHTFKQHKKESRSVNNHLDEITVRFIGVKTQRARPRTDKRATIWVVYINCPLPILHLWFTRYPEQVSEKL